MSTRAYNIAKMADKIFNNLGIDPQYASIAAFEGETLLTPKDFMDHLVIRRVSMGIGRCELARRLGYSERSLDFWEQKRVSPKLVTLEDWAQALQLELSMRLTSQPATAGLR